MYNQSDFEKSVSELDWMLPLIDLRSATVFCVHVIKTGCGQADAHRLVALLVSDGQYVCRNSLNEKHQDIKYRYNMFTFLKSLNSD